MCTSTRRVRRIMNVHFSSVVLRFVFRFVEFVFRFVRTCDGVSLSSVTSIILRVHR